MHVRLQKHYKMRAAVCLNISVSAAFRAAQDIKNNIVQDSLGYSFIPEFRLVRSKRKNDLAVRLGFNQCFCDFGTFATLVDTSELLLGSY